MEESRTMVGYILDETKSAKYSQGTSQPVLHDLQNYQGENKTTVHVSLDFQFINKFRCRVSY